MRTSPNDLLTHLDALGITAETVRHPPVRTVTQARTLRGQIPGMHTKTLFLRDRDRRCFLLCAEEDARIDLKRLPSLIGARGQLSFGSPQALMDRLDVAPGSVSPLGAINDREGAVTVVLDRALLAAPLVNCHPLRNDRTTAMAPDGLLRFLRATGHEPLLVSLAGKGPAGEKGSAPPSGPSASS